MGHPRSRRLSPVHKHLSYSHLKNLERSQILKQAQNQSFPVPNRRKPQKKEQEAAKV